MDAIAAALFTLSAGSSLGIANVELASISFTETLWTISGYDLTIGTAVSVAALVVAWFLNEPNYESFTGEQKTLVVATVILVLLGVAGGLESLVGGSVLIALAILGIEAGGYWAIAQSS